MYKQIIITNTITNFGDFPEYVFVSIGENLPNCEFDIIEDGVIPNQYKICSVSVYVIPKENFNEQEIPLNEEGNLKDTQEVEEYLSNVGAIKVITNIYSDKQEPVTSIINGLTYKYKIDLNEVQENPSKIDRELNSKKLGYYILIPLIILVIIIMIIKRKK